jgi:hypothetical protein
MLYYNIITHPLLVPKQTIGTHSSSLLVELYIPLNIFLYITIKSPLKKNKNKTLNPIKIKSNKKTVTIPLTSIKSH